jgi:hypothetical protein
VNTAVRRTAIRRDRQVQGDAITGSMTRPHAKAYLVQNKIPYREVDIDTEGGRVAFALVGGGGGIPLLFANGRWAQGYRPDAYDNIFANRS